MTNFTFNNAVPAAGNNPSIDQPDMLTNNVSEDGILAIDHVSFNTNDGGTHKQVNFINKFVQPAQTDPSSVLYTVSGTASTKADMRFKNENGIFPVNALRAYGSYVVLAGSAAFVDSFNVTRTSTATVTTITMPAGITTGTSFTILAFITDNNSITYAITGADTFTLTNNIGAANKIVSFIVLQT